MSTKAKLIPTQGCYQAERLAEIVGETRCEYRVKVHGEFRVRRFRKSDMLHVSPADRSFPNYKLKL